MNTPSMAGKLACAATVAVLPFFTLGAEPSTPQQLEGEIKELMNDLRKKRDEETNLDMETVARLEQEVYEFFLNVSKEKPPLKRNDVYDWSREVKSLSDLNYLEVFLFDGGIRAQYRKAGSPVTWGLPDYELSVKGDERVDIINRKVSIVYTIRPQFGGKATDYGHPHFVHFVDLPGENKNKGGIFEHPTLTLDMKEEHLSRYVKLAEELHRAYNLEPLPEGGR